MNRDHDIIVAPATAPGGAIAIVRLSGRNACALCDRFFDGREPLARAKGYTLHYGRILDGDRTVDDVLVSVFRAPHSYTGEDSVEISCHGSAYIVSEILRLAQAAGARMAEPGEFTVRAYLNGKLDLAQAEAVADLIASSSQAAHTLASNQMRGGYSAALDELRRRLLDLASLLELELDFSEEEVEFADRKQLRETLDAIGREIGRLRGSFSLGNAIKEGVAVAIAGAPNAGKSTLLNRLLNDERALVSDIAGTTRDVIEESANIDGIVFRFLDTAGIRTTDDRLEQMGIQRTLASIRQARIVIYLVAADTLGADSVIPPPDFSLTPQQTLLTIVNKIDTRPSLSLPDEVIGISARNGIGTDALCRALRDCVDTSALFHGDPVVSHSRHFQALTTAGEALQRALSRFDSLPVDLLAEEVRAVTSALGSITGHTPISSSEILSNIFSKFCIGK